ncbi:LTA synthase family protein [Schauerella aestuarii]|uniref:LTA synthase family protein n=1 Tax=Schauerella aestuarii TaxID=2511204 RepID=UPI0013688442|nr:LTA synthase family protein [Achromobacter aestuarii]MYZ45497.1 LTA synthase family protein [Achromobacter aestuarii]
MLEDFAGSIVWPYLLGLLASLTLEAGLQPRVASLWRRPLSSIGIHAGLWTLLFGLELMLFRRPYFGALNVLAIQLLLVLVNNAKFHSLREPFVFSDFEYFTDALRHPRLYLPFFGVGRALLAGGGYGAALWAGTVFEESLTAGAGLWLASFLDLFEEAPVDVNMPLLPFLVLSGLIASCGLVVSVLCGQRRTDLSFDAVRDTHRLGMAAALWNYGVQERRPTESLRQSAPFAGHQSSKVIAEAMPHLIMVQSESFFDVRRLVSNIQSTVFSTYDVMRSEASHHGQLCVPAWGANTLRTEFAALSGLNPDVLGVHRFSPYRKLALEGVASIASFLRSQGYRTICVHPYPASFYRRDRIFPALGFDEFIDLEWFRDAPRFGSYVSDLAVADYVRSRLEEMSDQPLFVYVITMENHGPLHWEKTNDADVDRFFKAPPAAGCSDLVAYVRHIANHNAMLAHLRTTLNTLGRPAALCHFGDHVPIMPAVYAHYGVPAGNTDYFIWRNLELSASLDTDPGPREPQALSAHDLPMLFLNSTAVFGTSPFACRQTPGGCRSVAPTI